FCLAACNAGLGTVMMGIYNEAEVTEILKLPEGQIVSCLIALGYPAVGPDAPKRKDVDELLSFR
ncbi:MAG: nitroreductase family protein, partial [Bacillota bacterium]|nr:nitroreductase family protein [Bacillota bacterium]